MSVEQTSTKPDTKKEPETLLDAIQQLNVTVVERLLREKASPNQSAGDDSLLAIAAQKCEPEGLSIVSALLEAKASATDTANIGHHSPLWHAVSMGRKGIVKSLLEANADPNYGYQCFVKEAGDDDAYGHNPVKPFEFRAPLNLAISLNDAGIVDMLLKAGAHIGEQSLWRASTQGYVAIVSLLLEFNASIAPDLLEFVAEKGHVDVIRVLIDARASVEAQEGNKPLIGALNYGHYPVAKALIEAKASVLVERNRRTALQRIMESHSDQLPGFLSLLPAELQPDFDQWYEIGQKKIEGGGKGLAAFLNAGPFNYAAVDRLLEFARREKVPQGIIDEIEKALAKKRGYIFCSGFWNFIGQTSEVVKPTPTYASLFEAIDARDCAAVTRFLREEKANPNQTNRDGLTPLYLAAQHSDREGSPMVSALLDAKAELSTVMPNGETALWPAVKKGRLRILEILLKAGTEANQTAIISGVNRTVLKHACIYRQPGSVRKLLEYKAIVSSASLDQALSAEMREHNVGIITALLDHKPDIKGLGFLHRAITNKRVDLLQELIAANADIEEADDLGQTPLSEAARVGSGAMVEILLAAKADAKKLDSGRTLLHLAAQGEADVAKVSCLLAAKVKVDAVDPEGFTALQQIIGKKPSSPQLVSVLVAAKATIGEVEGCKRSALDIARQDKIHQQVIDALQTPLSAAPIQTVTEGATRSGPDEKFGPLARPAAPAPATPVTSGPWRSLVLSRAQNNVLFHREVLRLLGSAAGFSQPVPQGQTKPEVTSRKPT